MGRWPETGGPGLEGSSHRAPCSRTRQPACDTCWGCLGSTGVCGMEVGGHRGAGPQDPAGGCTALGPELVLTRPGAPLFHTKLPLGAVPALQGLSCAHVEPTPASTQRGGSDPVPLPRQSWRKESHGCKEVLSRSANKSWVCSQLVPRG